MKNWVQWFRHVSPYIHSNRGKTIVLGLSGDALSNQNITNIVHDISLLNSLGMRIVMVFGARPQIDEALEKSGIQTEFQHGLRVTDDVTLPYVLAAYGKLRVELEAKLSMGLLDSPMHGAQISVVGSNYIKAKPVGVLDGVDMGYTGQVRNIDLVHLNKALDQGSMVLLPALGYSMTGDVYSLGYEELAAETAVQLNADKIVFFGASNGLQRKDQRLVQELNVAQAKRLLEEHDGELDAAQVGMLMAASDACDRGVTRAHLLSYESDGALLEELFTRDGSGTMVNADQYEQIRPATIDDVSGILKLIAPLEQQGYLVRRSQDLLETELEHFFVDERDGAIIGCAALYPFPNDRAGELSCFAVAADYRQKGRGDRLLEVIEVQAKTKNFLKLFVLTTKTEQWFRERGFTQVTPEALPDYKKSEYNVDRKPKVFVKDIS